MAQYQRGVQLSNDPVTAAESHPGTSSMLKCSEFISQLVRISLSFPSGEHSEVFNVTYLNCPFQSGLPLCVRVSSSHPTFSQSGRRGYVTGVCQLVYLILDICGGAVKVEVVDTTGAMVAFRLLTNMGSKQATLAAKNAWMQWRTAKRLENSSSWKHQGGKLSWSLLEKRRQPQAEIKSNLVHESAYTYSLQGGNNQTGNSYQRTLFLSASFSYFFCTCKVLTFRKVS